MDVYVPTKGFGNWVPTDEARATLAGRGPARHGDILVYAFDMYRMIYYFVEPMLGNRHAVNMFALGKISTTLLLKWHIRLNNIARDMRTLIFDGDNNSDDGQNYRQIYSSGKISEMGIELNRDMKTFSSEFKRCSKKRNESPDDILRDWPSAKHAYEDLIAAGEWMLDERPTQRLPMDFDEMANGTFPNPDGVGLVFFSCKCGIYHFVSTYTQEPEGTHGWLAKMYMVITQMVNHRCHPCMKFAAVKSK